MARCEVCDNEYDEAFEVVAAGVCARQAGGERTVRDRSDTGRPRQEATAGR